MPPKLMCHSSTCVKDVNNKKPKADGCENPEVWLTDCVNIHKGTENEAETEC